jgi:hypothetical protein
MNQSQFIQNLDELTSTYMGHPTFKSFVFTSIKTGTSPTIFCYTALPSTKPKLRLLADCFDVAARTLQSSLIAVRH